jgi:hypothetical protein
MRNYFGHGFKQSGGVAKMQSIRYLERCWSRVEKKFVIQKKIIFASRVKRDFRLNFLEFLRRKTSLTKFFYVKEDKFRDYFSRDSFAIVHEALAKYGRLNFKVIPLKIFAHRLFQKLSSFNFYTPIINKYLNKTYYYIRIILQNPFLTKYELKNSLFTSRLMQFFNDFGQRYTCRNLNFVDRGLLSTERIEVAKKFKYYRCLSLPNLIRTRCSKLFLKSDFIFLAIQKTRFLTLDYFRAKIFTKQRRSNTILSFFTNYLLETKTQVLKITTPVFYTFYKMGLLFLSRFRLAYEWRIFLALPNVRNSYGIKLLKNLRLNYFVGIARGHLIYPVISLYQQRVRKIFGFFLLKFVIKFLRQIFPIITYFNSYFYATNRKFSVCYNISAIVLLENYVNRCLAVLVLYYSQWIATICLYPNLVSFIFNLKVERLLNYFFSFSDFVGIRGAGENVLSKFSSFNYLISEYLSTLLLDNTKLEMGVVYEYLIDINLFGFVRFSFIEMFVLRQLTLANVLVKRNILAKTIFF